MVELQCGHLTIALGQLVGTALYCFAKQQQQLFWLCVIPTPQQPINSPDSEQLDGILQVSAQVPELCVLFHESVQALSKHFLAKERRHVYITPTSYLELIHSYKTLLSKKQNEVHRFFLCILFRAQVPHRFLLQEQQLLFGTSKLAAVCSLGMVLSGADLSWQHMCIECAWLPHTSCCAQVVTVKKRYEVGLEKLATTESSVADMQQELIALQPQLEVSTKETEAAMVVGYPFMLSPHPKAAGATIL